MLNWLEVHKPIFETLSFLANIGLVTSLIIGLRQLSLVKKDMNDRNKRAAIEKSIEYLHMFATQIIPKINDMNIMIKENKIPIYDGEINKEFLFDHNCSVHNKAVMEQLAFLHTSGGISFINEIEFLSAAFMSGLADEEMAFNPMAKTFCGIVERNYPLFCLMRENNNNELYSNTIKLYNMWKGRLTKRDLERTKQKIESDISQLSDQKVKPFGVM